MPTPRYSGLAPERLTGRRQPNTMLLSKAGGPRLHGKLTSHAKPQKALTSCHHV